MNADDLVVSEASAWRMRASALRAERHTTAASLVLAVDGTDPQAMRRRQTDAASPLQLITATTLRGSPRRANVRRRVDLERARIALRAGDIEERRHGHKVLDDLTAEMMEIRNSGRRTTRAELEFEADLSIALSNARREREAIMLTEQLLGLNPAATQSGNTSTLRDHLLRQHGSGGGFNTRAHLNNVAQRYTQVVFASGLGPEAFERNADKWLDRAMACAEVSLELRDGTIGEHATAGSLLVGRSTMVAVRIERACQIADLVERNEELKRVERAAKELVLESRPEGAVSPSQWRARSALLGCVLAERARAGRTLGLDEWEATARLARVLLTPIMDKYDRDADEKLTMTVRYADISWLLGARDDARRIWNRTASRVEGGAPTLMSAAAVALRRRHEDHSSITGEPDYRGPKQ